MLSGAEDILKNSKSKRHSIYRWDGSVEQAPSMEHSKANGGEVGQDGAASLKT